MAPQLPATKSAVDVKDVPQADEHSGHDMEGMSDHDMPGM
jgi:hypothetical protein